MAHLLRDGAASAAAAQSTGEDYDLIVVGGGISGLSAAVMYRSERPKSRVLILDNHDDFGGHAKRNEFLVDGHRLLLNGGTFLINSPRPYSATADQLMKLLGIDATALGKHHKEPAAFRNKGLGHGAFFGAPNFGKDVFLRLPGGRRSSQTSSPQEWAAALQGAPLSDSAKSDIVRVETDKVDYFTELSAAQTMDRLSRMSYLAYLRDVVKVQPEVLRFYQSSTHGEFGIGIDAEPALDCCGIGLPGFKGLKIDPGNTSRMGNTAAGYFSTGGSYSFHFPDGNATIARALVRHLVPDVTRARTLDELITARYDYSQLDRPASAVRIRLNATALNVSSLGEGVEVRYAQSGVVRSIRGKHCVLACYNMMIPYLVPDLPPEQKAALHELVKVPLVYTTVALRNWRAFAKAGVGSVTCPGEYFTSFALVPGPEIGSYAGTASEDTPIVLHMVRTPCQPGAATERDQHRAGRAELLATPLSTFEHAVGDQLDRALGAFGFDSAKDIAAITVNRWPHGYAYEYNPLYDPWEIPESARPHVVGRRPFGPISIANSDSGAAAYTDSAIDQAHRAVRELLQLRTT